MSVYEALHGGGGGMISVPEKRYSFPTNIPTHDDRKWHVSYYSLSDNKEQYTPG